MIVNKKEVMHENLAGYLFIAPSLIIFLVFLLFPIISSLFLSFTEWNFLSGFKGIKMVGLDNFREIANDGKMKFALKNTFVYVMSIVPASLIISMVLAYVLNTEIFAKKVLRFIFFIPYISSQVALAAVFKFMFRDDGILNEILVNGLHLMSKGPAWLSNEALNKIPICLLSIWSTIGYELIIYMAALQGVSASLYEAADIEGASSSQKFWKITFPLITPTTFYLLVVRIIAVFKIFSSVNIMTLGTYFDSNTSMVNEIYTNSFVSYKFGYASAEALVLVLLILAVTGVNFILQKKWVNYD
jgi:multiple sugar transport system permease protein